jgi:5'-3' exonuclease
MKNILLVDTSYTVFFRYNATKRWFSFSEPEEYADMEDDGWLSNQKFKNKYEEMFIKGLDKHIKNYKIDDIIWIQDDSRSNLWRSKLFPEYKKNRDDCVSKSDAVFSYTYNEFLPKFFIKNNFKNIKINGAEADDIIAVTTKYLSKKNINSIVVTSDTDFLQLLNDNTTLVDLKLKELKCKSSPEDDLEIKIIKGDKSDNIPPIKSRIGEKTAIKYLKDKELFKNLLKEPEVNKQYEMNKTLIDFEYIPIVISQKIINKLNKIFN